MAKEASKDKPAGVRKPAFRVGTSGWSYAGWWGEFYPSDLKKADALAYYTSRFCAGELNAPFYRTPSEKAVTAWHDDTPEGFRFSWKASRFISHYRRLLVDDHSLDLLESRVRLLGEKAGPILFQLPPQMKVDRERLGTFIARLERGRRYSFEFRDESWYVPEIFDLLTAYDAALCISDHAAAPAPRVVTAGWVYVRNHGPSGRYHGNYSDEALGDWARSIEEWRGEGREVWCFFDNDQKTAAPKDAERLAALVGA
ncbi:MAG: DUF72 domain-containing protein [Pararhizobium sp.]